MAHDLSARILLRVSHSPAMAETSDAIAAPNLCLGTSGKTQRVFFDHIA